MKLRLSIGSDYGNCSGVGGNTIDVVVMMITGNPYFWWGLGRSNPCSYGTGVGILYSRSIFGSTRVRYLG